MSKSRTIKPRPGQEFNSPFQWFLAAAAIGVALMILSNVLGFVVMLVVAFAIGQAANRILPTQIPYGYLGSTAVGIVGWYC